MEEDKSLSQSSVQNPTTEQASPAQEKPIPKFKRPILIGLLVLSFLIIGTVSATYLFVSKHKDAEIPKQTVQISPPPSVKPTATWKTYTSAQYGFLVDYPASWYVWGSSDQSLVYMTPKYYGPEQYRDELLPMVPIPEGFNIQILAKRNAQTSIELAKELNPYGIFTPANIPNIDGTLINFPSEKTSFLYIVNKGRALLINLNTQDKSLIDYFIQSFKFIH